VNKIAADALAECDGLDGVKDAIVSNMAACRAGADERLKRWACPGASACLNAAQLETVKLYHAGFSDAWQPAGSTNGYTGYNVLEGVEMNLGDQPRFAYPLKDGPNAHATLRADEFLRHFVARDTNFDLRKFDVKAPGALEPQLKRIAELIGATSPDYSAFARRGGKVLLMQGADDASVSPYENIRRYQSIVDTMGAPAVRNFMRFYVVPGQGHGIGTFQAGWDNLDALDAWVDRGVAPPAAPIATDNGLKSAGRSRPLCEYPKWPRYKGSGDPDQAANFACAD
jgi:feruloyl esterase